MQWPDQSPDPTRCDLLLRSYIESKVYEILTETVEQIKWQICRVVRSIDAETVPL